MDRPTYGFLELFEEVSGLLPSDENQKLSLCFLDKCVNTQSFIQLEGDESYEMMLAMYEEKKETVIYVTQEKITVCEDSGIGEYRRSISEGIEVSNGEFGDYEEDSDYCHSEASYHSRHSDTEDEDENDENFAYGGEFYSYEKDSPKIEVEAKPML